jgi:hypothetical protein
MGGKMSSAKRKKEAAEAEYNNTVCVFKFLPRIKRSIGRI